MTKGQAGRIIEPTYEESLTILGLDPNKSYTAKEIHAAYLTQARKNHPYRVLPPHLRGEKIITPNPEEQALMDSVNAKMSAINEAYTILSESLSEPIPRTTDIDKALALLKSKIPYNLSLTETMQRIGRLQRKAKGPIEDMAISDAISFFLEQRKKMRYYNAYSTAKSNARFKKSVRIFHAYPTEETRTEHMIKEYETEERIKQKNKELLQKIKHVFHGKEHVPIIAEHPTQKKKGIKKWVILTAGLAAAIIGGAYIYNHYFRAYRHKELKPVFGGYLPKPKKKR
jgi:hypothetical protein